MKWSNRTAQGRKLSALGDTPTRESPCRGDRDTHGFGSTGRITHQRNRSGSVLVYVLVLVVITGLIATSYLTFVDNQRARTGRNLNQDGLRITTEQALLSLESTIRSKLLANGQVDLSHLNGTVPSSGISLSLNSQTDSGSELQVDPFANATEYEGYKPLVNQDLFGQAHARVTTIDVDITASSAVPEVRLPDLNVTDHPQIAVREIPVSQFTVFSAGDPFTLGTTVFSQDIGRVFAQSTLSVAGSFSSEFAIVAGQNVNFQDGSLQVKDPSGNSASVTLSSDTQGQSFLPDARTSLDSRIVTGSVLPIESAALNSVYSSGNNGQLPSNGLNLELLQKQCVLFVVAYADVPITTPDGKKECKVTAAPAPSGTNLTYPAGATKTASQSQGTVSKQMVPFAAAPSKQSPSQTILALDLQAPGANQLSSVFLVAEDRLGNQLPNAVVLIRGATTLHGPISIVSPYPIIIAGDFNTDGGNEGPPPASIITPGNVQTVAQDWGSDVFGTY